MTKNLFVKYPEFITSDPRTARKDDNHGGYRIDDVFQYHRHNILLPPESIAGMRVLDLGSCVGATGAWVMECGASRYVGVELQAEFCNVSRTNLTNRFPNRNWEIKQQSFNDFFENNNENFDIIVAFGALYDSIYVEHLVKSILKIDPVIIVVDSIKPYTDRTSGQGYISLEVADALNNSPIIKYSTLGMVSEQKGSQYHIEVAIPSQAALEVLMSYKGYGIADTEKSNLLADMFPSKYTSRFLAIFKKSDRKQKLIDFESTYQQAETKNLIPFNSIDGVWVFDSTVADNFETHAKQHIPDYSKVIQLGIDIAKDQFADRANARIIDVGSATGETIKSLFSQGFYNLVGVESSPDMINKTSSLDIAHWILGDQFPIDDGPYHAIFCNWTLHFIQDKIGYLKSMYQGLMPDGFMILSDKTCNSGIDLKLYHNFKRSQGVSEDEITNKAASVKDIMFINEPNWYLEQLKLIGFDQVSIINAAPCFTTFLAIKKPT